METIKPINFEIRHHGRGFDILATMSDGKISSWGKDIKTERGAKSRMTQFKKRYGMA